MSPRIAAAAAAITLLVTGCASTPAPVAMVTPPPAAMTTTPVAPLPEGATPGMTIPAVLPDGSYPTPNRALSAAATLWHVRAGLNVAALACRGEQGQAIVTGYNALLSAEKAPLAQAEASYAAEYRASGDPAWRDRYDDDMTRLYNYFSQTPPRAAFCAAAAEALTRLAGADTASLNGIAAAELPALDRPFPDFYRAYDAWRAAIRPVIAVAALPAGKPHLELDLSKLPAD